LDSHIYFLATELCGLQFKAPWMARLERENKYGYPNSGTLLCKLLY
jgi:hypothetical protein